MLFKVVYSITFLGILLGPGVTCAEGATSIRPSEYRGIERVREYLTQDKYAEAIAALEPLLERKAHHPMVDFYRGLIAQSREDYAGASTWFERSVAKDPTLLAGWINLAQCRFQIHDYSAAAQAFTRSYALSDPTEPRWNYNAALAWYQAGEMARARELIQKLMDDFPATVELQWHELLVHIYQDQDGERNHRLALPHVQILARESSAAPQRRWREYLIHLYLQLDMPEAARKFVNHLLEVESLEARWWRIAAHLHLKAQRYADALVALQVAGFLAPGDAREERLRADLCMQLGVPVQAIPYFNALLENHTSKVEEHKVLMGLAQAYVQRHKPQKALEYLAQIDTTQGAIALLRLRARILYMLEDYAQAYAAYVELARREQQNRASARAWLLAGYAAWNAEKMEAAQTALAHAAQEAEFSAQAQPLLRHIKAAQ